MDSSATLTHGAVEGGQVKTDDSSVSFGTSTIVVPNSNLTVTLAPGDDDLFVVEFSAECDHIGTPPTGSVEVKAVVSVGFLTFQELEPGGVANNVLAFCGPGSTGGTHSMTWAVRLSNDTGGQKSHTFSIWARVTISGSGLLDKRTVRVTRYN